VTATDVFDDLDAEETRLEEILASLDDEQWRAPSGAEGWSICDVVLHLAQSEELAAASAALGSAGGGPPVSDEADTGIDARMDARVRAERAEPHEVFERWRAARHSALGALRAADPGVRLAWVGTPLKPATLATTRLAEHWAHALDVTAPFDIPLPDTNRLRHIAWLGHSTLPYAFGLAGEEPRAVRCELVGPEGDSWLLGPGDAGSWIRGDAGAFCRVGAHRLTPAESGLDTGGPYGAAALGVLRNYVG
jgi:uncharacterized protein (TIGR03084 family)